METKVNYTIVGLFVIVLGAALITVGIWIGKHGQTKPYQIYAVDMKESVSGLSVHASVRFNGVNVGTVMSITLDQKDPSIVHLLLKIQEKVPITESTVAMLNYQGITGVSYIELKAKTPNAPPLQKKPGQEYPEIAWAPSIAFELDVALRDLNANFKNITQSINQLMNPQNLQSLQTTLASLAKITNTLASNSDAMQKIMKNTAGATVELPAVLRQVRNTLVTINSTTQSLGASGSEALQNISQQMLPNTQEVLTRLNDVLNNLQQITSQLQSNPSILVRGRQVPPLGPGER